ncbi:MAG: AAA family ATPase [Candidatus Midichloria sp.]|nr:AAA family ATPase [Candidatus Midichloria sp.]
MIDEEELIDSLKFLSELLYKHHKQPVYILVDEYDKPVNYLLEAKNPDQDIIKNYQINSKDDV